MDQDLLKLRKLATLMRSEGVLLYKTPEIELQLAPAALFADHKGAQADGKTPEPEFSPEFVEDAAAHGMTPEDWKLVKWSTPGV